MLKLIDDQVKCLLHDCLSEQSWQRTQQLTKLLELYMTKVNQVILLLKICMTLFVNSEEDNFEENLNRMI